MITNRVTRAQIIFIPLVKSPSVSIPEGKPVPRVGVTPGPVPSLGGGVSVGPVPPPVSEVGGVGVGVDVGVGVGVGVEPPQALVRQFHGKLSGQGLN